MKAMIIDTYDGNLLGQIETSKMMTNDEALRLAGYDFQYWPEWDADGWSDDGGETVYFADEIEIKYYKDRQCAVCGIPIAQAEVCETCARGMADVDLEASGGWMAQDYSRE